MVTAIGSFSAAAVIGSLSRLGYFIVGTDTNSADLLQCAKDVDCFKSLRKGDAAQYYLELEGISASKKCDLIIPLTDREIDLFRTFGPDQLGTTILAPPIGFIDIARDKSSYVNTFQESQIFSTVPTYSSVAELLRNYPNSRSYIAKPKDGRSSEGLIRMSSLPDDDYFSTLETEYIFQPAIIGDIITVDVIRSKHGEISCFARRELIRTGNGAGLVVDTIHSTQIIEASVVICEQLSLLGVANIEFIVTQNHLYLMDINPRFSAGISFTIQSGYDVVLNALKAHHGEHIEVSTGRAGLKFAKWLEDHEIKN